MDDDDTKPEAPEPLMARVQEQIESGKAGLAELKDSVSSGLATGLTEAKSAVSDAAEKVEEVASDAQEALTKAARSVVATIKANPVPAAMVGLGGIGLAMFLINGRSNASTRAATGRRSSTGSHSVGGQASTAVRRAKQSIGKMSDSASQTLQRTSKSAQARAQKLGHAIEENPIKVSAGALLVGVGVGLLLPSSARENQWLGATRDSLVSKGHALAHQAMDKVEAARQLVTGDNQTASDSA